MAATIVKEDGSKVADANCYFEIEQLRAYYEGHHYSAVVDAVADDDDLIAAAITACRMVDSSVELSGVLVSYDQDMAWPRLGARMRVDPVAAASNGVQVITGDENVLATGAGNIPANVVPKQYVKACMEMVRFVLVKDRDAAFDKPAVKREKIDVIEREFTEAGSAFDLIPELVQRMLRPFTISQEDQGAPAGAGGVGQATAVRFLRA